MIGNHDMARLHAPWPGEVSDLFPKLTEHDSIVPSQEQTDWAESAIDQFFVSIGCESPSSDFAFAVACEMNRLRVHQEYDHLGDKNLMRFILSTFIAEYIDKCFVLLRRQ